MKSNYFKLHELNWDAFAESLQGEGWEKAAAWPLCLRKRNARIVRAMQAWSYLEECGLAVAGKAGVVENVLNAAGVQIHRDPVLTVFLREGAVLFLP